MAVCKPLLSTLGVGFIHVKALTPYTATDKKIIQRTKVPADKISWSVPYPSYNPEVFIDPGTLGNDWADPKELEGIKFNAIDGKINRKSFMGEYKFDAKQRPLNPIGRTGLAGRGRLGRWGPNHAADPIVTRWKRNEQGKIVAGLKGNILQFVSICRKDNLQWAIPGGMVDAGENVSETLRREFNEEALDGFDPKERSDVSAAIEKLFSKGVTVYQGYVDDPRNTDNAWMETVAVNFHDEDGTSVAKLPLAAGDDAGAIKWQDIGSNIELYASHKAFIEAVAKHLNADW